MNAPANPGALADIAQVGERIQSEVQRAIQRLNWIHSNVDRVQQTGPEAEFPWAQFPWADWARQIDEARAALQTVRTDARSSAPPETADPEPSEAEDVG